MPLTGVGPPQTSPTPPKACVPEGLPSAPRPHRTLSVGGPFPRDTQLMAQPWGAGRVVRETGRQTHAGAMTGTRRRLGTGAATWGRPPWCRALGDGLPPARLRLEGRKAETWRPQPRDGGIAGACGATGNSPRLNLPENHKLRLLSCEEWRRPRLSSNRGPIPRLLRDPGGRKGQQTQPPCSPRPWIPLARWLGGAPGVLGINTKDGDLGGGALGREAS